VAFLDLSGDAFRRTLDEVRRRARLRPYEEGSSTLAPGLGARFDLGPERGGGGEARWGLAMNWADEAPAPHGLAARTVSPDRGPVSSEVADDVARELGFAAGMTAEALTKRWRSFVWRNHPDRQPAHARERANARVAAANALYDQARRGQRRA
jgi:hypothetical protein